MSSNICYKITVIVCKDRNKTTTKTMVTSITKEHEYKDYSNKYNKLSKTHRLSWSLHLKFCDALKNKKTTRRDVPASCIKIKVSYMNSKKIHK